MADISVKNAGLPCNYTVKKNAPVATEKKNNTLQEKNNDVLMNTLMGLATAGSASVTFRGNFADGPDDINSEEKDEDIHEAFLSGERNSMGYPIELRQIEDLPKNEEGRSSDETVEFDPDIIGDSLGLEGYFDDLC